VEAGNEWIVDAIMKQETTAFLAAAQARGCATQIGIDSQQRGPKGG
jgi:hypothetical protein